MSDEDLRELERRFQATGLLEDEVLLLRARRRAGALTEDKLLLAAYAGSQAARACVDTTATALPEVPLALEGWVERLAGLLGYDSALVSTAARMTAWLCAEWVCALRLYASENHTLYERAVAILRAAWEFPTSSHRIELRLQIPAPPPPPIPDPFGSLPFPGGVGVWVDGDMTREVLEAAFFACFPLKGDTSSLGALRSVRAARPELDEELLWPALQRAVREWALGYARPDPEALIPR